MSNEDKINEKTKEENLDIANRECSLPDSGARKKRMLKRIAELEMAVSIGANIKLACESVGIDRQTYYYRIKKGLINPDNIKKLQAKPLLKAIQTIYDNLSGEETAKWYLERRMKDEFSKRSEVTGKDGAPIAPTKIVIIKPDSVEAETIEVKPDQGDE